MSMNMLRRLILLLLLLLPLIACVSAPTGTSPLLSPVDSPLPTATPLPTMTPTSTTTAVPTQTPVPTFTLLPSPTVTPEGIAPPPGLIYRNYDGIWRIEANGQAKQLFEHSVGVAVSPDGARILYVQDIPKHDTLWLIDTDTGQCRKLIEGFDGALCCPVWWPSRPDWVLVGSWPRGEQAPDLGHLTVARLDSKEYRILDTQNASVGLPAPSPDGRTIAYDGAGPQLYQWGTGSKPFDVERHGVQDIWRIASPAWSPDGKRLAWYVGGDFGKGWQVGVAVFDLTAHTGRLLHIYTNLGRGGWFAAPSWSPNGQWLAFDTEDEDPSKAGLWIVRADGSEEHAVSQAGTGAIGEPQVWSHDGRWLVSGSTLVEISTWRTQQLALPLGAQAIGWVALPK